MNCTSCGSQVNENQKFCGNCGLAINTNQSMSTNQDKNNQNILKCPNCNHTVAKVAKQCPNCGNELQMSATSTYIISGILLVLAIGIGQAAPVIGIIFIGIMFMLMWRLVKKRFDRKLNICYGNIIQHREYEDSFLDELIKEIQEANNIKEEKQEN